MHFDFEVSSEVELTFVLEATSTPADKSVGVGVAYEELGVQSVTIRGTTFYPAEGQISTGLKKFLEDHYEDQILEYARDNEG